VLGKALTDTHELIQDAMARVVAHLQDEFDDKLDIIKSKHDNEIAETYKSSQGTKTKIKTRPSWTARRSRASGKAARSP
jgi:hypothetical protein